MESMYMIKNKTKNNAMNLFFINRKIQLVRQLDLERFRAYRAFCWVSRLHQMLEGRMWEALAEDPTRLQEYCFHD